VKIFGMHVGIRDGYTRAEPGGSDHCIRVDDLTFIIETPIVARTLSGGSQTAHGSAESQAGLRQISEFRVLGTN
jgi:hypothetical protein